MNNILFAFHMYRLCFIKRRISLPISGSRDSEINIDGLPDYRMGESADIEEIEFFSDSEEES